MTTRRGVGPVIGVRAAPHLPKVGSLSTCASRSASSSTTSKSGSSAGTSANGQASRYADQDPTAGRGATHRVTTTRPRKSSARRRTGDTIEPNIGEPHGLSASAKMRCGSMTSSQASVALHMRPTFPDVVRGRSTAYRVRVPTRPLASAGQSSARTLQPARQLGRRVAAHGVDLRLRQQQGVGEAGAPDVGVADVGAQEVGVGEVLVRRGRRRSGRAPRNVAPRRSVVRRSRPARSARARSAPPRGRGSWRWRRRARGRRPRGARRGRGPAAAREAATSGP